MGVGIWLFASVALVLLSIGLYKSRRLRFWSAVIGSIVIVLVAVIAAIAYMLSSNVVPSMGGKNLADPDVNALAVRLTLLPDLRPLGVPMWTLFGDVTNGTASKIGGLSVRIILYDCPAEEPTAEPSTSAITKPEKKYRILSIPNVAPVSREQVTVVPAGCVIVGDTNANWHSIAVPPSQKRKLESLQIPFEGLPTLKNWHWRYSVDSASIDG